MILCFRLPLICLIIFEVIGIKGLLLAIVSNFIDRAKQQSTSPVIGAYTEMFMMLGSFSAAFSILMISFLQ